VDFDSAAVENIGETMKSIRETLQALIEAAKPFTSGDVIDETTGTIPLLEALQAAIDAAEAALSGDHDES
jgi:hypothetical protein